MPDKQYQGFPKQKRIVNEEYKIWIRSLPCFITGRQAEAHHCSKTGHGSMGSKTDDTRCIPLSHEKHTELHQSGAITFAKKYNLNYENIIKQLNQIWEDMDDGR